MPDPVDNAAAECEQLLDYGLAAHRRRQLAESAQTINWLGLCHDCDEYIDPARLEAQPRAWRCIDCQTEHERDESRR